MQTRIARDWSELCEKVFEFPSTEEQHKAVTLPAINFIEWWVSKHCGPAISLKWNCTPPCYHCFERAGCIGPASNKLKDSIMPQLFVARNFPTLQETYKFSRKRPFGSTETNRIKWFAVHTIACSEAFSGPYIQISFDVAFFVRSWDVIERSLLRLVWISVAVKIVIK